jgi:hypothetical protein
MATTTSDPRSICRFWATYFVPGTTGVTLETPLTTGFRIDAPDPGTGC